VTYLVHCWPCSTMNRMPLDSTNDSLRSPPSTSGNDYWHKRCCLQKSNNVVVVVVVACITMEMATDVSAWLIMPKYLRISASKCCHKTSRGPMTPEKVTAHLTLTSELKCVCTWTMCKVSSPQNTQLCQLKWLLIWKFALLMDEINLWNTGYMLFVRFQVFTVVWRW
jgi:hypothetical protein